jgi:hypothetical protein
VHAHGAGSADRHSVDGKRLRLDPPSRLRNELLLDVYWATAEECERRHRSLHVDNMLLDGAISLRANADSRMDAAGFRECYWRGVHDRVGRRREAGQPVPENVNLTPDIDID